MPKQKISEENSVPTKANWVYFLAETGVYAVLVAIYFFLVRHFLGGWLKPLFEGHPVGYAFLALGLMVFQGFLLEMLTTALFRIGRGKSK